MGKWINLSVPQVPHQLNGVMDVLLQEVVVRVQCVHLHKTPGTMPGTQQVLDNCRLLLFFKSSRWYCEECTLTDWKLTSKSLRTCSSNTWQVMAPWHFRHYVPTSTPRCLNVGKRLERCLGLVIPKMSFWVYPGHWRKGGGWCRVSEWRHCFGRTNGQPEDCRIRRM